MRVISSTSHISPILISSVLLCFGIVALPEFSEAAARLIRVPLQRSTTESVGSLGQPIVNYFSIVNIGTPAVPFKVQFDVGLSEHFVPHYSWNPFNTNLHYSTGFQCKSSSTCNKIDTQLTFSYQHVQLTAKRYDDSMTLVMARANNTLDPYNAISPTVNASSSQQSPLLTANSYSPSWRQNFLAASSASDARFSKLPIDGFFGLSPAPQSPSGVNSLLVSMHNAKLIDNLQFSLWFNPVLDSPNGGELIIGGVDTNRYQGQIYWHHLAGVSTSQWVLNLQSVSLGNQVIGCTGGGQQAPCQAVLSSGTSDILGPREDVRRLYNLLNTTRSSTGLELIDCRRINSLPYITFQIDGIPYYLLPSNYIRKTIVGRVFKTETCYVAILPSNDDAARVWTLATPFLGAYYSIYDITYRQVGFAALR